MTIRKYNPRIYKIILRIDYLLIPQITELVNECLLHSFPKNRNTISLITKATKNLTNALTYQL